MEITSDLPTMDGFNKSLEELLRFADCFKLREKELEQQYQLELEKQKAEYDIQIQLEKRRNEQLQEINRTLTEQLERGTQKQVDFDQKYTVNLPNDPFNSNIFIQVLFTKYNCCIEECKQIKDQHQEKKLRIEELEKIARILNKDKTKLEEEIKQLKIDNQNLQEKINEMPTSSATTSRIPDEFVNLAERAVAQNEELKKKLTESEKEIAKLNEQLNQIHREDPNVIKQRLSQEILQLKNDFRTMYEAQFNFFLQNIDRLKQAQRDNIARFF